MGLQSIFAPIFARLPPPLCATWKLRAFGLLKIPTLFAVWPTVEELSDESCVIRVGLNWRTRNHLGTMYLAVLAAGADAASGMLAIDALSRAEGRAAVIFKDFKAEFRRRADGDVRFRCDDGRAIRDALARTLATGERQSLPVMVTATVGDDVVAEFTLTMSMKRSSGEA